MSVDDLLLAMIIVGMALSGAYLRAQYATRRSYRTAERRNALQLSKLYGGHSSTRDPTQGTERRIVSCATSHAGRNVEAGTMVLKNSLPVRVRCVYRSPVVVRRRGSTPI
jgi:hypothetical protein